MQHDCRQRINMIFLEPGILQFEDLHQFLIQPAGAEKGVIHKIAVFFRMRRLAADSPGNFLLGHPIWFADLFRNNIGQHVNKILKRTSVYFLQPGSIRFFDPDQWFNITVGDINKGFLAALLFVHFKIGHHLLKGDLERIADVVEQGSQSPVFQEGVGTFLPFPFILEPVGFAENLPEPAVGFIDRQPQRKHIH